jgi:hypothetical protein
MSFIQLSQNEIDKNELKSSSAGAMQDGVSNSDIFKFNDTMAALPVSCGAWCSCTCFMTGAYSLYDSTGRFNATMAYYSTNPIGIYTPDSTK